MTKPIFIVVVVCAITIACDRDAGQRSPPIVDEAPTPVERPDAATNSEWCKQHGVPESRCVPCLARKGSGSESLGAGTCGIATATCEDTAVPTAGPRDVATKPLDDLKPATTRRSRSRARANP